MAQFSKDWVDAYFDNGVDVANRRIFLDSDIDEDSISNAIKGLYLMETKSKELPCEIFISSCGGSVYDALALYDIINTLKCPVHTFAYGKCLSAAPLLLAAGEQGHRWCAPHVVFMHHDWCDSLEGKGAELTAWVKHGEALNKTWTELLTKHTNKNFKWWNERGKRNADFYFTAEQAVEWGVADAMWLEK